MYIQGSKARHEAAVFDECCNCQRSIISKKRFKCKTITTVVGLEGTLLNFVFIINNNHNSVSLCFGDIHL